MHSKDQQSHPTGETLADFARGRLEDDEAEVVAAHLGVCASCQQALAAIPNDPLFALLCSSSSTPVPHPDLLDLPSSQVDAGSPPELTNHPRYRLLQRLGGGGMGVVYKAEHRLMRHSVALKVISKQLTASAAVVERFRREMQAVARLRHPNLVQAHDAEQAGELHFLVMEYIEGVNLAALVESEGPLPVEKACACVRQAALGLAHALEQGLVHRDIKPHNLMLTPEGQVKVIDFGLASIGSEQRREGGLTGADQPMGTPDYMAPEQIRDARSADTRADIYSLGCTLYFLLTGRPPFPDGDTNQKMAAHLERQPEPLAQLHPGLPADLVQTIERMMAKDPAGRFQSPGEVVAAMSPFCEPAPDKDAPARARWWWSAAALLLVLSGAVSLALLLRLQTEHGTLEIASDDEDVLVAVKRLGKVVEIVDTRQKRTLELRTGAYELELRDQDRSLELTSNEFTLTREGKKIAVVRRVPTPPVLSKLTPFFDDDFSDPKVSPFNPNKGTNSRNHDQESNIDFFFEKNRFVVLLLPTAQKHRESFSYHTQGAVEHFACQMTGRVTSNDKVGLRLLLFGQPLEHCLDMRFWDKGEVELIQPLPEGKERPLPGVGTLTCPNMRPIREFNTLLVMVQGRTLTISVNDAALGEPIRLKEGLGSIKVGMGVCQVGSGEARGEFSRFTLWKLPAPVRAKFERWQTRTFF